MGQTKINDELYDHRKVELLGQQHEKSGEMSTMYIQTKQLGYHKKMMVLVSVDHIHLNQLNIIESFLKQQIEMVS